MFQFSGGILGLFTGMSIISLFELPFWFTKIILALCKNDKIS